MASAGAFISVSTFIGTDYEGFIVSKANDGPEYHWVRIQGVDPCTGSPAHARLEASPSLELLLGGAGALGHVCSRLRGAPSVQHFLADLQEVVERLTYSADAGPGPGSKARPGLSSRLASSAQPSPRSIAVVASACTSSSSSSRVMELLLRDLDAVGWGCLEELDQDAARLTLMHMDSGGREHRLRLTLPYDYPTSSPAAATDLPMPFTFGWKAPAPAAPSRGAGHPDGCPPWGPGPGRPRHPQEGPAGGGRRMGGDGCGCSNLGDVFEAFKQAVSQLQPLWSCLADLDTRTRVLDPPPTVSAARRHLGPPARRLALGGAASLALRLDPVDPRGPPPPGGVAFLGPPDAVARMREAFFSRLHLWSRERGPVENLEELLGQALPTPLGVAGRRRPPHGRPAGTLYGAQCDETMEDAERQHGSGSGLQAADATEVEEEPILVECSICLMHVLPVDGWSGGVRASWAEGCGADGGRDADGGGLGPDGLVPEVLCPTPACGLAFHAPCLAEWLRSLPDTRVSFSKLFGRCPFCSNPITVRA